MEALCRFGSEGCGIEEVVAFIGLIVSLLTLAAGVTFALSYIQASRFSEPVVKALTTRLEAAEGETIKARAQADAAMEVATGRAAIGDLVQEVRVLVGESKDAHATMSRSLEAHEKRAQESDRLTVRSLELIVARIEPDNGRRDRRLGDRPHA